MRREGSAVSNSVEGWTPRDSGCRSGGAAVTIEEAGGSAAVRKRGRPVVGSEPQEAWRVTAEPGPGTAFIDLI